MVEIPETRTKIRLPRVRRTILSLMIAVAVVGTVLGFLMERRSRFQRLAAQHSAQIIGVTRGSPVGRNEICHDWWCDAQGEPLSPEQHAKEQWHRELASKYLLAAREPWLSVEPDPPEP